MSNCLNCVKCQTKLDDYIVEHNEYLDDDCVVKYCLECLKKEMDFYKSVFFKHLKRSNNALFRCNECSYYVIMNKEDYDPDGLPCIKNMRKCGECNKVICTDCADKHVLNNEGHYTYRI